MKTRNPVIRDPSWIKETLVSHPPYGLAFWVHCADLDHLTYYDL